MRADYRMGYHVPTLTIGKVLAAKAESIGDRRFLTFAPDGRTYTFRDVHLLSNRLANGLRTRGIRKGSHVAVMMQNCPEQLLTYFALGKLGAVAVPINVAMRGTMLTYFLSQSDSSALVIQGELLQQFLEIGRDVPLVSQVVVLGDESGIPAGAAGQSGAAFVSFADASSKDDTAPDVAVDFRDLAFIMYTSGTTGPSKGVMFGQARSLLAGLNNAEAFGFRHTDRSYVSLPLFHLNALQGSVYAAIVTEGEVVLAPRFSASQFWGDIRKYGVTMFNMLGSMANILWSSPPSPDDTKHAVRMCLAMPMPPFALEFEARFGLRMASGYGISDFASTVTYSILDPVGKLGSAGRSRQGYELKIVDDNDFDVPANLTGEIVLRSNYRWDTSTGYYKNPEATLAAWRNGWFHTGDRGYLDEDGYLYFADRKKDSIRRRGENVSASEVEQIILKHPAVADTAVFAVSAEMSEDEVAAAVVLRPGMALKEIELVEFCSLQMAAFMVPRYVLLLADLPRTETQKIEKGKLRSSAEADRSLLWDRLAPR